MPCVRTQHTPFSDHSGPQTSNLWVTDPTPRTTEPMRLSKSKRLKLIQHIIICFTERLFFFNQTPELFH